ncbi:exosome complex protein Rrp42 [Candidatus Woesearchaeota archaeon]|nr:exosome complex protein Rrp42 [Candidatus Woesearchaeota archaeon]
MKNQILKYVDKGFRYDGRGLLDFRSVSVEYGVAPTAEGSARVVIGDTIVLAGVKLSIEAPYPDTPNKGNLMVNAELLPLSSPDFEPGPPGDFANEVARVVDRSIREGKTVDFEKLCITEGEKVWSVAIDVVSVNDAGNILDACALAALAALKDTKFPEVDVKGIVKYDAKTSKSLPLMAEPVLVTISFVNGKVLLDTAFDEEKDVDSRLSIACLADGSICAMQKGGVAPITSEQVLSSVNIAVEKSELLRSKL